MVTTDLFGDEFPEKYPREMWTVTFLCFSESLAQLGANNGATGGMEADLAFSALGSALLYTTQLSLEIITSQLIIIIKLLLKFPSRVD